MLLNQLSLNTGFVPESMNPYFEELMVSEYIWLIDSNDANLSS